MGTAVVSPGLLLQNILFATDFSPCSEKALSYAVGLSRHYGCTLYTVNVIREQISEVQPPDPFYLRHIAERNMAALVQSDPFAGIRHQELLKEGEVSQLLPELIQKLDIDLVILGTHGRGGVTKFMLGSLAEEIVGTARCPVLAVGPHVTLESASQLNLRRILYATDLLPDSAKSLAYALWLAEHEHAHLTLLHVIKLPSDVPSGYSKFEQDMAMKRLMHLLSAETPAPVETDCIIEIGSPAEHILKVATEKGADLIVMSRHHTSFARLSAHLPWITPHQVLCHALCPVLTVPCLAEV